MENIKEIIRKFLADAKKIVFLAIGSPLRADDAAGIIAAEKLLSQNLPDNFKVLIGYTAPENLTGEIKRIAPTHLIICDAANSNLKPGEISVISVDDIEGAAFSTHMLPMNVFIDYITHDNPCKTLILGIQPETLEFGADMTQIVREASIELASIISDIIK